MMRWNIKLLAMVVVATLSFVILGGCEAMDSRRVSVGGMDASIERANDIKNAIEVKYVDASRNKLLIKNADMEMVYDLQTEGNKMASILSNTMDVVLEDNDGHRYRTSLSQAMGRVNIYRHGLYYYDVHVLDLEPVSADQDIKPMERQMFGFDNGDEGWTPAHSLSAFKVKDGILTTHITGGDPYMIKQGLKLDAETNSSIEIRMKLDAGSSGQLFFATQASPQMSEDKSQHFAVNGDGQYHTYIVDMRGIATWKGTITALRIDIDGADTGDGIYVDYVKLIDRSKALLPVKLETVYHVYPDKLYQEIILHFTGSLSLKAAYLETRMNANIVEKARIKDATGERDINDRYDENNVEYAAFDIEKAGTLGFIYPVFEGNGNVDVTKADKHYSVKQFAKLSKNVYDEGDKIIFGNRIYMSKKSSMKELAQEAYIERNPLGADRVKVLNENASAEFKGYQPLKGYYSFASDGMDFNKAYYNAPNQYPSVQIQIKNDGYPREIYVQQFAQYSAGSVESAAVLNQEGYVMPIPIEVSKNFKEAYEEPFYDPDDIAFSESYFPLVLAKDQILQFTSMHLYQNWGNHPLKQISSIRFFTPYYHLSTGVTETTCWAPFFFGGHSGFILTDFRPMSGILWSGQPQHDTSGEHRLFQYKDRDGWHYMEYKRSVLHSVGPNYSDITLYYSMDDGKANIALNAIEMPQTDENRVFTSIDIQFNNEVCINDVPTNLNFYSVKSTITQTHYRKYGYLDQNDKPVEKSIDFSNKDIEVQKLGDKIPFWAIYDIDEDRSMFQFMTNISVIIKDWDITVGGRPYNSGLALAVQKYNDGNIMAALTLPVKSIVFKKGDHIKLNVILMPYGSYKVRNFDNVMAERQHYGLDDLGLKVEHGKKKSSFVPTIQAQNEYAEFTLNGGYNNVAVKVEGFKDYRPPKLYEYINDKWVEIKYSVQGHDGYQIYIDENGKYGFTFVVKADGGEHRYKVESKGDEK